MGAQPAGPRDDLVTVGLIATVHGLRGELVVAQRTDEAGRLAPGSTVLLDAPGVRAEPRRIQEVRSHKGRLLVLLEGVPDRTAAEALRGGRLCVREADLRPLPPGQVWLHELPGMSVATAEGEALGSVHEVLETGGDRQVLVVRGPRGEFLLPFAEQFVRSVDRTARRLTVRLIDGLLS